MTAGGEADDTDALWVEVPGFCIGADEADGALSVGERGGVVVFWGEAVAKDEGGDAVIGEPLSDDAGLVSCETAVPAARADDEGGAGGFVGGWEEDLDGGDIGGGIAELSWGFVRPEVVGLFVFEFCGGGAAEQASECESDGQSVLENHGRSS